MSLAACVAERILTGAETLTLLAMTHRAPKQRLLRLPESAATLSRREFRHERACRLA